jgi:hypothetical protein
MWPGQRANVDRFPNRRFDGESKGILAGLKNVDMKRHEGLISSQMEPQQLAFYEFFAGGGMARLGLGSAWRCTRDAKSGHGFCRHEKPH